MTSFNHFRLALLSLQLFPSTFLLQSWCLFVHISKAAPQSVAIKCTQKLRTETCIEQLFVLQTQAKTSHAQIT